MEDFRDQVERLRVAKGWSKSRLVTEASSYNTPGTSPDTIRNAVSGRRGATSTTPAIPAMSAIAMALGVDGETFPAYRLAMARRLLDPDAVGEAAIVNADALLAHVASARTPVSIAKEEALRKSGKRPSSRPSATRSARSGPGA